MLPLNHPDHIRIAFDDRHQATVNAGLLFPATQDLKHGVGLNHLPSGRFAANAAWLAVQVMAHNLARRTVRIGLGEQVVTTKTLRRRFSSLAGRLTRSARRHPASDTALALGNPVQWRPGTIASHSFSCLTAPLVPPTHRLPNRLADSRPVGPRASLAVCRPDNLAQRRHRGPPSSPLCGYRTLYSAISIGIKPLRLFPLPLIPSVDPGYRYNPLLPPNDVLFDRPYYQQKYVLFLR